MNFLNVNVPEMSFNLTLNLVIITDIFNCLFT